MKEFFERKIIKLSNNYVKNLFKNFDNRYFFHDYNHSLGVAKRNYELAKEENLKDFEIEMLVIAGLFHDTGFIIDYDNNEVFGSKIAKNFLENIGYDKEKIKIIENIILATIISNKPNNIYEEIIKDSDLDNLGRDDFFEKSKNLKKEIQIIKNLQLEDKKWLLSNLDLIENYDFYTKTQKNQRDKKKEQNIKKLREIIKNSK